MEHLFELLHVMIDSIELFQQTWHDHIVAHVTTWNQHIIQLQFA